MVFVAAVANREPVDELAAIDHPYDEIYFFTELLHLAVGSRRTADNAWGAVVSEVSFEVGAPRWRVFSRKILRPDWRQREPGAREGYAPAVSSEPMDLSHRRGDRLFRNERAA